ncbi:MIP family channel protein [Nocardioides sp. CER19]|uniref:MIP family channel protein n=1 Tax=Nocardioides sp. CER19 TaxID=3038538 RepID=UPI002446F26D|nr:MIP family channel protein [Nocardioides sp. CER19]MDH2413662.1 MIP family channel protein [Nocardioides sp. CER19]
MQTSDQVQKLAAEALGTFILVVVGCGAAISTGGDVPPTGLAFGIAVLIGVYAFGRVSGGHFNPAVTVGAAIGGRFPWRQVPLYVAAQVVAAIVAALVLFVSFQGVPNFDATGHMGQNGYGDHSASHFAWWAAFLVELVFTAIFVIVILGVTDERNEHPGLAPLAIGLALAGIHFVLIPLTGTSVNPARSIGPALFAGGSYIVQLWLFILAPLVGGVVGGLVYPVLFGHATEPVAGSGMRWGARARAGAGAIPGAVPGYGAPDSFQQQWNQDDDATGVPGVTAPSETTTRMPTGGAAEPAAQPRIIQDGWEWDYAAQQWKPLQEPPTEES